MSVNFFFDQTLSVTFSLQCDLTKKEHFFWRGSAHSLESPNPIRVIIKGCQISISCVCDLHNVVQKRSRKIQSTLELSIGILFTYIMGKIDLREI